MKIRQTNICHTCRARKLGCDGKKPACSQCLFSRRECAGYEHDFLFKHQQRSSPSSAKVPTEGVRTNTESERSSHVLQNAGRPGNPDAITRGMATAGHRGVPPSLLPRQSFLEESSALIVSNYAPWLESLSILSGLGMPAYLICGSWVGVLSNLAGKGRLDGVLYAAIGTLGLVVRRKEITSSPEVPVCSQAYGSALALLQNNLLTAYNSCCTDLVAASMCLSLSELMMPTLKDGWLVHLKGITSVLQLSGPERFRTGVSHQLFTGIRPLLLFEAFKSRKPFFLASAEWQTVPFLLHPPSHLQSLINDIAGIPSLLEMFDMLIESPLSNDYPTARDIWLKFSQALITLDQWELQYRLDTPKPLYWPKRSHMVNERYPTSVTDQKTHIWFRNVLIANAFTYLWAFRIVCITHMERIELQFPNLTQDINAEPSAYHPQTRTLELSFFICQSMEYLLQDEVKLYGPLTSLFPFKVAQEILKLYLSPSDQTDLCQGIIDKFMSRGLMI
ncbi:hypothetical protein F5884DRAFT_514457 [Xylogone sp. PMI_703]|nr:hypothetical protein F5884DRAFT_514457 [Xylogone sp. PMI_703]